MCNYNSSNLHQVIFVVRKQINLTCPLREKFLISIVPYQDNEFSLIGVFVVERAVGNANVHGRAAGRQHRFHRERARYVFQSQRKYGVETLFAHKHTNRCRDSFSACERSAISLFLSPNYGSTGGILQRSIMIVSKTRFPKIRHELYLHPTCSFAIR